MEILWIWISLSTRMGSMLIWIKLIWWEKLLSRVSSLSPRLMNVSKRPSLSASPVLCTGNWVMSLPSSSKKMDYQSTEHIAVMELANSSILHPMCLTILAIRLLASWKPVMCLLSNPWLTQVSTRISHGLITGLQLLLMDRDQLSSNILSLSLKMEFKSSLLDCRPLLIWKSLKNNDLFIYCCSL